MSVRRSRLGVISAKRQGGRRGFRHFQRAIARTDLPPDTGKGYQWPVGRLTTGDMQMLDQSRADTGQRIGQLLDEAMSAKTRLTHRAGRWGTEEAASDTSQYDTFPDTKPQPNDTKTAENLEKGASEALRNPLR